MAATIRPAFIRPLEYINPSPAFSSTTGTPWSATDSIYLSGTYANVASMIHAFCVVCTEQNDVGATVNWRLSDDLIPEFTTTVNITINFDDTDLSKLFGMYTGQLVLTAASWTTVDCMPGLYCAGQFADIGPFIWIPTNRESDQTIWSTRPRDAVSGVVTQSGKFVGNNLGWQPSYKMMLFPLELASNLSRNTMVVGTDTIDPTAESFFTRSMNNYTTDDDSAETTGFWVYPDVNDLISDCGLTTTEPWNEATNIGTHFDQVSNADIKAFCATTPEELPSSWCTTPGMLATRLRYNESIGFHTVDPSHYPAWIYDDYAG